MWQIEVLCLFTLYLVLGVPLGMAAPNEATFTTIDFPGATFTQAVGINSDGDIVGTYFDSSFVSHGFLLRHRRFTTIDFPGAFSTGLVSINSEGDIVGQYLDASFVNHGFLLSHRRFTTIDFPGAAQHQRAWGLTLKGDIVGNYYLASDLPSEQHNYLLEQWGFHYYFLPWSSQRKQHQCDQPSGEIAGAYGDSNFFVHGFLLSHGKFTSIDFPGAIRYPSSMVIDRFGDVSRMVFR